MMSIAALLLAAAAPAPSQGDRFAAMTHGEDRAVMAEVATVLAARPPDLARLDALLLRLAGPSRLRGMVQTVRAQALARTDRTGDSLLAIEEAMRLLPDDPVPQFSASHILTFAGAPQRGADLWLTASRTSPGLARQSDAYVMSALVARLREIGDHDRADRLELRLGEIGFAGSLAPARSSAAFARVRNALAAGGETGIADARAAVAAIGDPRDLMTLAIDRRYEAVWPQVSTWGGPDLADASRRFLGELRRDWGDGRDLDRGAAYARRLADLRAHPAVVALFLPVLERPGLSKESAGVEFLAPIVARSLTALGRREEASTLLARVEAMFAGDTGGNGLNLPAARLTLAAGDERWVEVIPQATAFVAAAAPLGPAVNDGSTAMVRAIHGCALWKLGRRDEAEPMMAAVLLQQGRLPDAAMRIHLCRADAAATRAFLMTRLADETTRSWALRTIQPRTPDLATALNRSDEAVMAALRRDPDVAAAANRVGRILPTPLADGLPPGFDPLAVPGTRPEPGSI